MRETFTSGSVRGVRSNSHPYRDEAQDVGPGFPSASESSSVGTVSQDFVRVDGAKDSDRNDNIPGGGGH